MISVFYVFDFAALNFLSGAVLFLNEKQDVFAVIVIVIVFVFPLHGFILWNWIYFTAFTREMHYNHTNAHIVLRIHLKLEFALILL